MAVWMMASGPELHRQIVWVCSGSRAEQGDGMWTLLPSFPCFCAPGLQSSRGRPLPPLPICPRSRPRKAPTEDPKISLRGILTIGVGTQEAGVVVSEVPDSHTLKSFTKERS